MIFISFTRDIRAASCLISIGGNLNKYNNNDVVLGNNEAIAIACTVECIKQFVYGSGYMSNVNRLL